MKKCVRCGKEVADEIDICEECGFSFSEHEKVLKYNTIKVKVDPLDMTKQEKISRIDMPILSLLSGMIGLLCSVLIIATYSILIILLGFLFSVLAIYFSSKPSLVKLTPLKNVGKWFGYIAFALTLFFSIYILMGIFF